MTEETMSIELKKLENKFKRFKVATIILGIISFIIMLLIVVVSVFYIASLATEISEITDVINASGKVDLSINRNNLLSADYLAIVIPVLVALGGSLIAFLGMNRLKMFDEHIDQIRMDMLSEIDNRVKNEVAIGRLDFTDDLLTKIATQNNLINTTANSAIEQINAKSAESANHLSEIIENFRKRYNWLELIISAEVGELSISTVADAHDLVETLREKKPDEYISMIKKIVEKVCSDSDLSGDSADYHNLSAELARGNMYYEAVQTLEKGLSLFTDDTDLLSDIIEYSTKNSQFDKAEYYIGVLDSVPKWRWTWRCYEFTIDYYRATGAINKAYDLSQKFIEALPYDEHGYRSKAEIEMNITPGEEGIGHAITTLQVAMEKRVNGAQCAQKLADIYLSRGQYKEAIEAASRVILELAQEQPHIGVAGIISTRGFAYDRLFMENSLSGDIQVELAQKACSDYQMALSLVQQQLGQLPAIILKQVLVRMSILSQYLPNETEAQ